MLISGRLGRGWTLLALWILAWNVAVPLRLYALLLDAAEHPEIQLDVGAQLWSLALDQTTWAIATAVMFRLALIARQRPVRGVVTLLALLAIPLMAVRYWAAAALLDAFGRRAAPVGRMLLYNGPLFFFLLMAAAALGLLVVYVERERDSAVLHARLEGELALARLQTLRLQLNPHFLFNALNSIVSLVHSDIPKADTALTALSSFLRASLSVTRGEETTLASELRLVDSYLEIESLRFDWLTVHVDVPEPLRSACVPAFVLQLLVENAIRHGLVPRRAPGRVTIAARVDGAHLAVSVSDDGVGVRERSSEESLGIGLRNIRARLAQLHGDDGTVTLAAGEPQGTVATIRVPYRMCASDAAPGARVA